ncbi:MAG: transposase [Saprospiraceae bacterium]|jgi:transposase
MSKLRKQYTKSEKLEIVSLSLEDDQTVKDLSVRFGVSQNAIYNWRSVYAKHKEASFPGKGNKTMSDTERKILHLERQLKEKELEVEILKKAVHIFSDTGKKFTTL